MTDTLSSETPVNDIRIAISLKKKPSHLYTNYPLFKTMGEALKTRLEDNLWYLSEDFFYTRIGFLLPSWTQFSEFYFKS